MSWTVNRPQVKVALIATSRNNFSRDLSQATLDGVSKECLSAGIGAAAIPLLVETEEDALAALDGAKKAGCNALAVLLGNFGPEAPEAILAQKFGGPVMFAAATEDSKDRLYDGRRDAYCGLLNCSYNLALRHAKAYIPPNPVGTAKQMAVMIADFVPIAAAVLGVKSLKVIAFGPRPREFFACNAPIKGLYDLGVEVQENSELDLLLAFKKHAGDPRIAAVTAEMQSLVGKAYADTLPKMAQYEVTLLDWFDENKGASNYAVFANKCWPAFQQEFGFLPCYVHGRLGTRGIPVGCETDLYGTLSEFIGQCVGNAPVTLLDINNSIPDDLYAELDKKVPYAQNELFIGFHCGNTPASLMRHYALKFKMNRKEPYAPETGSELTRGTLEGALKPGPCCCYRLHGAADGGLQAYIAKGEILPKELASYGCYAVFGVPEMARFYRHVLIEKRFPHHSAILYGDHAATLYEVFRALDVPYIGYNRGPGDRYESENPFCK